MTWVRANLEQAATTGHGWLMEAARARPTHVLLDHSVSQAHTGMRDSLITAWADLVGADQPDRAAIAAGLTVGVLDAGFRQLDDGQSANLVVQLGTAAADALVGGLSTVPDGRPSREER